MKLDFRVYERVAKDHPPGATATWEMVLEMAQAGTKLQTELFLLRMDSNSKALIKALEKQVRYWQREARRYKELFEAEHPVPGADPTRPDHTLGESS